MVSNVVVVVDSNPLHDDPLWTKPSAGKVAALARRGLLRLAIPQVVLHELERQRRTVINNKLEQLRAIPRKIDGALLELGVSAEEAGIQIPAASSLTMDFAIGRYRDQLQRFILEANVQVLPVPDVTHADLLKRDLAVRKPFEQSGRGYRDALIWSSVLEFAESLTGNDELFFVTNDQNFRDINGLDASLAEEVATLPPAIKNVETFEKLLENPSLEESRLSLEQALERVPSVAAIAEAAVEYAVNELSGDSLGVEERYQLEIPPGVEDIEIESAQPTGGFDWDAYDEFDGTTVLGKASIDTLVELRGWVAKEDAALLADPDIGVQSWSDDLAEVVLTREGRAFFDLRVEVVAENVEDITFLGFVE